MGVKIKNFKAIVLVLCMLVSWGCEAEVINAVVEDLETDKYILIELDTDTSVCTRFELPYEKMYIVPDLQNESIFLARGSKESVQLFELEKDKDIQYITACSKMEHAFGFYDGWLYGTNKGRIVRQKEDAYQEMCLAPDNYTWRNGRDFKPAVSPDGKVAFVKWNGERSIICVADPESDDPEKGSLRFLWGMSGGYLEFEFDKCNNKREQIVPGICWFDSDHVVVFQQRENETGEIRIEAMILDVVDGEIIPFKLQDGKQFVMNDCTHGGLSAYSKASNNMYASIGFPADPMWYMYNEAGVPFGIYQISCETGMKTLMFELANDEYFVECSQLLVR